MEGRRLGLLLHMCGFRGSGTHRNVKQLDRSRTVTAKIHNASICISKKGPEPLLTIKRYF